VAQFHTLGIIERTMKTMLTFVLLSFLLAGCSRRDATIQRELTGTWTRDFGNGFRITNVISPDGSYQCQIVGLTNGTIDSLEGRLIAKNGVLIDTVTKDSETNQQTPRVMQWQIVHIDRHELVLSGKVLSDCGAIKATFDKVER
jgi:hypothetical protein